MPWTPTEMRVPYEPKWTDKEGAVPRHCERLQATPSPYQIISGSVRKWSDDPLVTIMPHSRASFRSAALFRPATVSLRVFACPYIFSHFCGAALVRHWRSRHCLSMTNALLYLQHADHLDRLPAGFCRLDDGERQHEPNATCPAPRSALTTLVKQLQ
jgi:hypothetical protein